MRLQLMVVAAVVAFTAGACERARPADEAARPETQTSTAEEQSQRQNDTAKLEQRVDELEREWNGVRQRLSRETAEARQNVEERIAQLRDEIRDLRTTNEQNWLNRYEQRWERAANEVEQEVRQFARRWTPADRTGEVGTTGDQTGWEARRDRLVKQMEARIEDMERALDDNDARGRNDRQMNDTRERLDELRDDTNRLRNASADDWWDTTRDRVNEFIDRTEAMINRLATGSTNEPARNRS